MHVIIIQKILGLCGLKGHFIKISLGVMLEDGRTDEGEDRAKILETEFAILAPLFQNISKSANFYPTFLVMFGQPSASPASPCLKIPNAQNEIIVLCCYCQ